MTISALVSVCGPRTPIRAAEVRLIHLDPPGHRSRSGRIMARRNLCSHVQAVLVTIQPQHPLEAHGTRTLPVDHVTAVARSGDGTGPGLIARM